MSSRSHTSKKWYFPGHDKNTVANILRQKFRIQLEDYDCDRILRLYAYMREFWTDVRNPGSARNIRASVNNIQVSDAYALSYATDKELALDLEVLEKLGFIASTGSDATVSTPPPFCSACPYKALAEALKKVQSL